MLIRVGRQLNGDVSLGIVSGCNIELCKWKVMEIVFLSLHAEFAGHI